MKPLFKFYLQVNTGKEEAFSVAEETVHYLLGAGAEVTVCREAAGKMANEKCGSSDIVPADADCIVVIGGDGSILDASEAALALDIPLIGINLGHLGYLAELSTADIPQLAALVEGKYTISRRLTLSLSLFTKEGTIPVPRLALNEVVVSDEDPFRMIDLLLTDSGNNKIRYRGDGLILATPSGSTAYSFSAGGPVIHPDIDAICVTPRNTHSLFNRAVILPSTSRVEVRCSTKQTGRLAVCIDGRRMTTDTPCVGVAVTRGEKDLQMITLGQHGMINTLRQKMREAELKY